MRRFCLIAAAFLGLCSVVVTGCGSSKSKSGGSTASGATLVKADLLAFVSVDSDTGSSQWQQVDELSHKFPGRDKALARLNKELAEYGLDYSKDVEPALGPEVDVAVAAAPNVSETSPVVLTKPDDAAKLKDLVAKLNAKDSSGKPAVYREVGGWYAISNSQAAIDRVLKGGGSALSGDGTYQDALAKLPDDALAKAYVNGEELAAAIRSSAQPDQSSLEAGAFGLDKLDFISASLSAESDGVRLKGVVSGAGSSALSSGDYSSKLLQEIPGDALAFLTFRGDGLADQIEKLKSNPTFSRAFQQFQASLGVSYDDVLDLLRNEVGFYLRPGVGIPEFTLVLAPKDQGAALATLDKLAQRVAAVSGGRFTPGEVRTVTLGTFPLRYGAASGGRVVITTAVNGIERFGGPGDKLPDSADFKEAKEAAGMPGSNGGFAYVDLKNVIPLIEGFAGLAGANLPPDVTDNLRPLRSFLAWSAGSGGSRTFDAFLEIK